jgi:hypothetical protein
MSESAPPSARRYGYLIGAGVLLAVVGWFVATSFWSRRPYSVSETALSGWKVVPGPPGDAAVVALQPPPQLSADLFRQVSARTKEALVAPEQPLIPLVLLDEYSDSLQGVLSVDDIIGIAEGSGLDAARFEPVCVAERTGPRGGHDDQFYVLFEAPAFVDFRQQLTPLFPEHAGGLAYEPGSLNMVLPVAATDQELARRAAAVINQQTECVAAISPK